MILATGRDTKKNWFVGTPKNTAADATKSGAGNGN